MRIHLIAIGGSIMHNLAIALKRAGHDVTGSDDEIYDPSRSRLEKEGLLPEQFGWNRNRIDADIDTVILGMHARPDNPELKEAQRLGLNVTSFPEYIARMSAAKKRVVVAGSHGKTSTTSMIMHILRKADMRFDYLVGAQLPDFELMVSLSDAPIAIFEGDEYLSSPIDRRPKFLHYDPDIAVITGIAWDHMNVFPTKEIYHAQFALFLQNLRDDAACFIYCEDEVLTGIAKSQEDRLNVTYYDALEEANGKVEFGGETFRVGVFGRHNRENMHAAILVCDQLGVPPGQALRYLEDFEGASMRLDVILDGNALVVYRDFAHAPSKVRATTSAVRSQYPDREVTAFVELHTFSSLNRAFLPEYKNTLDQADSAIVYFSRHTLEMKKLPQLEVSEVAEAFDRDITVCTTRDQLRKAFEKAADGVHLWMSSGRFGGLDIGSLYN